MNLDQLKKIAHLDQLKAGQFVTPEEYDTIKARIVDAKASPVSPSATPQKNSAGGVLVLVMLAVCGYALYSAFSEPEKPEVGTEESRTVELKADIRETSESVLVVNNDILKYGGCELEINGSYKTKTFSVDPGDTYYATYGNLINSDGTRFDIDKQAITDAELYCKDVGGSAGILLLNRK